MLLVRMAVIGSGNDYDPYRVATASYIMRSINPAGTVAVVSIPDDDIPPGLAQAAIDAARDQVAGTPVIALTLAQRIAWRLLLRRRYPLHTDVPNADLV